MWRGLLTAALLCQRCYTCPVSPRPIRSPFRATTSPWDAAGNEGGKMLQMKADSASGFEMPLAQSPVLLLSMSVGFLQLPPTVCVCMSCDWLFPNWPKWSRRGGKLLTDASLLGNLPHFLLAPSEYTSGQEYTTLTNLKKKKKKLQPSFRNEASTVEIQNTDFFGQKSGLGG